MFSEVVCHRNQESVSTYCYAAGAPPLLRSGAQKSRPIRRLFGFLALYLMALTVTPAVAEPTYLLVPGDILRISVFKSPDLSLDVRVSESGAIGYPLIGAVPVSGLTLPAAEKKIAQLLQEGGFVINPQVSILLTEGFGDLVSVIGEVNKSGRYSTEDAGGHVF